MRPGARNNTSRICVDGKRDMISIPIDQAQSIDLAFYSAIVFFLCVFAYKVKKNGLEWLLSFGDSFQPKEHVHRIQEHGTKGVCRCGAAWDKKTRKWG